MDEYTTQRSYFKITILDTVFNEISDQIFVSLEDMKGPRSDLEFQYFMDNIQIEGGESYIDASINIRNNPNRF